MADTYHEVVIEGAKGRAYGFVEGFLIARGLIGKLFNLETEGFECESLRERIREMFHPSEETYHLLVRAAEIPVVHEAVREAEARGLQVKAHDDRPVAGARFHFEFQIFSREHAKKIRKWFKELAPGISLSKDTKFQEKIDPESKGVEAYAPSHEYELSAAGTVEGDVVPLILLHRLCADEELVKTSDLTLTFSPA